MKTTFRKVLIAIGKLLPFILATIVAFGYLENVLAITTQSYVEVEGVLVYDAPISNWLASLIYIDWFDVLIAFIMCVAFDLCRYAYMTSTYILLNLGVRTLLENVYMQDGIVVSLCAFMAAGGFMCVILGIRKITT